jgi:PPIC-type PPIASE domain
VRWLRDPLFLFLGLGAAIFAGWTLLQHRGDEIRITPAIRAALVQDHQALTGHAPSPAEQRKLIEDWLAEEILFREAVARGLHLNDPMTRERLVERLTLMVGGGGREPTEADLLDQFATHRDHYRAEPQISFEQRFFVRPPADPAAVLARLRAGQAVANDDFWMGQQFQGYGLSMLRGLFGKSVLDAARTVPVGEWHGPYVSARGVHYIRVESRAPARAMTYLAAREQVKMDWLAASAGAPIAQELARVRDKYRVVDE